MATTEEIIEAIGNMSVLELVELKKAFEETFDVTAAAAAPVMMAAAGAATPVAQPQKRKTSLMLSSQALVTRKSR